MIQSIRKPAVFILLVLFFLSCKSDTVPVEENISDAIETVYISCSARKLKAIYKNYNEDKYIPIKISTKNGKKIKARMRLRGDTSREFPKKSLKIKFDGTERLFNSKTLNLNAEYDDPTLMRQYMASKVIASTGYPCFETDYINVFINGEFRGLYLKVEQVNKSFLRKHDFNPSGKLYKASRDGACLNNPAEVTRFWEMKLPTKLMEAKSLEELIIDLDTLSKHDFRNYIYANFEADQLYKIMALNMLLSNASTYYHNYYLYLNPDNYRWTIFPWDMDKTFSRYKFAPYLMSTPTWINDNLLIERVLSDEFMLNRVREEVNSIADQVFNPTVLYPLIDSIAPKIEKSVLADSYNKVESREAWLMKIEEDKKHIAKRRDRINFLMDVQPGNFRLAKTPDTLFAGSTLKWETSFSRNNDSIRYRIIYGPKEGFSDKTSQDTVFTLDTFLQLPRLSSEGYYKWIVQSYDSKAIITGYNDVNTFYYKQGTILESASNKHIMLDAENSPYYIQDDVIIKNGSLKVEPGCTILFSRGKDLTVFGEFQVNGSEEKPVVLRPAAADSYAGLITIIGGGKSWFKHTELHETHVYARDTDIEYSNTDFYLDKKNLVIDDRRFSVVWLHGGHIKFAYSSIYGNNTGEGMNINKASAEVYNSYFTNTPDAIEYIEVNEGLISENIVRNSSDDAVDLNGCSEVVISGNLFLNNFDKGISVGHEGNGSSNSIIIENNFLCGSKTGLAIKDSSQCLVQNNTFYENKLGIHLYHKNQTSVGGIATCENNYFVSSVQKDLKIDSLSLSTVQGNLTNSDENLTQEIGFKKFSKEVDLNDMTAVYTLQNSQLNSEITLKVKSIGKKNQVFILNESNMAVNLTGYSIYSYRSGVIGKIEQEIILSEGGKLTLRDLLAQNKSKEGYVIKGLDKEMSLPNLLLLKNSKGQTISFMLINV
jgi:spore coat protein H